MKCDHIIKKRLDSFLATHTIHTGWSSESVTPQFAFSKMASYNSCKIYLILLHTFGKRSIALSISTSLGAQNESHICIQLVTRIVLHCHKTILRTVPSDSNGSGLSQWVRDMVQTEPFPNWGSRSSRHPNHRLAYSTMINSQPV